MMRLLYFFILMAATFALRAAEDPAVSKVTTNSLDQVRAAMESFRTQARTNTSLRPFISGSPLFSSGDIRAIAGGVQIGICDCGTLSACYVISATTISPTTTRIEVRSGEASPEDGRAQFRPKRNARVMEELVRLLESKP